MKATSLIDHYNQYKFNDVKLETAALYDNEFLDKTFQTHYLNPKILGKTDSLPHKIGYFTTPINLLDKIHFDTIALPDNYKDTLLLLQTVIEFPFYLGY